MGQKAVESGTKVLDGVVTKTNSELILFFLIIAVIVIAAMIFLIPVLAKRQAEKIDAERKKMQMENTAESEMFERWTEREREILNIIKEDAQYKIEWTKAITKLTNVLETNNKNCNDCKNEQVGIWKEMNTKLDQAMEILRKVDSYE